MFRIVLQVLPAAETVVKANVLERLSSHRPPSTIMLMWMRVSALLRNVPRVLLAAPMAVIANVFEGLSPCRPAFNVDVDGALYFVEPYRAALDGVMSDAVGCPLSEHLPVCRLFSQDMVDEDMMLSDPLCNLSFCMELQACVLVAHVAWLQEVADCNDEDAQPLVENYIKSSCSKKNPLCNIMHERGTAYNIPLDEQNYDLCMSSKSCHPSTQQ